MWTLPNILTISRMFLGGVPTALAVYYGRSDLAYHFAFWWLLFWEVTDFLDGYLARRWRQTSAIGKLLDPLADVKTHLPIFVSFMAIDIMPIEMGLIIIMREVSVTGGRAVIATLGNGEAFGARWTGKTKTVSYAISQLFVILHLAIDLPYGETTSFWLLAIATTFSAYTWAEYGYFFWKKIQEKV